MPRPHRLTIFAGFAESGLDKPVIAIGAASCRSALRGTAIVGKSDGFGALLL